MSGVKRLFYDLELLDGTTESVWKIEPYYICILWGGHLIVMSESKHKKGGFLSMQMTVDGYPRYKINNNYHSVHSLVAQQFIGNKPHGYVTNHIDGNKMNNDPSNLEYVTPAENIRHSIENGFHVAADVTRMPTYKDGRCIGRKAEYKKEWYMKNRKRILDKMKLRYQAQKQERELSCH